MNAPIRFNKPCAAILAAEQIIFCVGQEEERIARFHEYADVLDIPIKPLVGSYKGQEEHSFLIDAAYYPHIAAWIKDEESILLLGHRLRKNGATRKASLYFVDSGETVPLGAFGGVDRDTALASDAWTHDPQNGGYFLAA